MRWFHLVIFSAGGSWKAYHGRTDIRWSDKVVGFSTLLVRRMVLSYNHWILLILSIVAEKCKRGWGIWVKMKIIKSDFLLPNCDSVLYINFFLVTLSWTFCSPIERFIDLPTGGFLWLKRISRAYLAFRWDFSCTSFGVYKTGPFGEAYCMVKAKPKSAFPPLNLSHFHIQVSCTKQSGAISFPPHPTPSTKKKKKEPSISCNCAAFII